MDGSRRYGGPPYEVPDQQKKSTKGLTIVLAIIGGGLVIIGVAVGVGIYAVMSSPRGRALVGLVSEAVKISAKAQRAPGTKALRAAGCEQALVFDVEDLRKIMHDLDAGAIDEGLSGEMVMCTANQSQTCDAVAATYVGAVGTRPKPITVTVQENKKVVCLQHYDGSGQPLGNGNEGAVPVFTMPDEE